MAAITFTRKGRRKHRRRKGKTCRERSLVDYRKAPDTTTNGPSAASSSTRSDQRDRKRQLRAPLSSCVVDPRQMLAPAGSSLTEDESDIQFFLRKKQSGSKGTACRTPLSKRRPSMIMGCDGASSEEESTSRELRSMYRRDSMSHASKCDSWASPAPSPCCVMSDFPTLTPRRSVIRSRSSDSLDSMDSMGSSLPDIPSFSAGSFVDHRSSARFSSPRRARRQFSIPLKSFSDAGLNLLLKMHEELREATAQAEQVRREKAKMAPKRSKSRQRKDKEIHTELTKKAKPKATRGGSTNLKTPASPSKSPVKVKTPATPSKSPVKVKSKKLRSPKVAKESPGALSEMQLTPKQHWALETIPSPRTTPTTNTKSKQAKSPEPKAKLATKAKAKKNVQDEPPRPPTSTPTKKQSPLKAAHSAREPSPRERECKAKASDSTASTASCTSESGAESRMSRLKYGHFEREEPVKPSYKVEGSSAPIMQFLLLEVEATKKEAPMKSIQVPILSLNTETRPQNTRSRMVKEMHKTLTKKVVLETFPRVTVTSRRTNEAPPTAAPTAVGGRSRSTLRMNEGQVTTVIQAIIEDREDERQENPKDASRRPSLKSARRLGSRVQQAIHSLGFN